MPREIVIADGMPPVTRTFDDNFLAEIMDPSELQKLTKKEYDPNTFTVRQEDVGSVQEVTISVTNRFSETSNCTVLFDIKGKPCCCLR